jgi:hypothetical protein
VQCDVNPCLNSLPPDEDGFCSSSLCKFIFNIFFYLNLLSFTFLRLDNWSNSCVYDNCSRFSLTECLQHDTEGLSLFFIIVHLFLFSI